MDYQLYLLFVAAIGVAATIHHFSRKEKQALAMELRKEGKIGVWMEAPVPSLGNMEIFHTVDFGLSRASGIPQKIRPCSGGPEIPFSNLSLDTQQFIKAQCDAWANERFQLIVKLNG